MRFTQVLALASSLAATAFAANARVVNRCTSNVYVKTNTNGNVITLSPNGGLWSQPIRGTGNQVFIGVTPQLPMPMEFDYSVHTASGDINNYYAMSTKPNNNPFQSQGFSLIPADNSCRQIHCASRNDNYCPDVYNPSGNTATFACQQNSDLTVYTCQG